MSSPELVCNICAKKFLSWKEMQKHFQTSEHKGKSKNPLVRMSVLMNKIRDKVLGESSDEPK